MAKGACVLKGDVWQRGMHGKGVACMVKEGMHGKGVACMVKEGMHGKGWGGVYGRRDGHCSGWYASCWNAFLLNV